MEKRGRAIIKKEDSKNLKKLMQPSRLISHLKKCLLLLHKYPGFGRGFFLQIIPDLSMKRKEATVSPSCFGPAISFLQYRHRNCITDTLVLTPTSLETQNLWNFALHLIPLADRIFSISSGRTCSGAPIIKTGQ